MDLEVISSKNTSPTKKKKKTIRASGLYVNLLNISRLRRADNLFNSLLTDIRAVMANHCDITVYEFRDESFKKYFFVRLLRRYLKISKRSHEILKIKPMRLAFS